MKFYFPDSQDLVSPTYDFARDEYSPLRVRQRDDRYAHEVLRPTPYHGLLVSKAIVDGSVRSPSHYTEAQRQRLYRLGVHSFFRLPDSISTLGDNGAFNYADEELPPYTASEVLDFYEGCGFAEGISIDHVIFGYDKNAPMDDAPAEWSRRLTVSLDYAEQCMSEWKSRDTDLCLLGAAQGWSPASYAFSVKRLQEMGYSRIALGGMVPLKSAEILECLREIDTVREAATELHLLGITRVERMEEFAAYGVTSFDSTSAFRQAFMDDRKNFHTETDAFVALRVPQVDGNVALKRAVLAGRVNQRDAVRAERTTLETLRAFDRGAAREVDALEALGEYEALVQPRKSYLPEYARTLAEKPWKFCECTVCSELGIEAAIFRGTERNKRRGFHNMHVLARRMQQLTTIGQSAMPKPRKGPQ